MAEEENKFADLLTQLDYIIEDVGRARDNVHGANVESMAQRTVLDSRKGTEIVRKSFKTLSTNLVALADCLDAELDRQTAYIDDARKDLSATSKKLTHISSVTEPIPPLKPRQRPVFCRPEDPAISASKDEILSDPRQSVLYQILANVRKNRPMAIDLKKVRSKTEKNPYGEQRTFYRAEDVLAWCDNLGEGIAALLSTEDNEPLSTRPQDVTRAKTVPPPVPREFSGSSGRNVSLQKAKSDIRSIPTKRS
eukprot:204328_1